MCHAGERISDERDLVGCNAVYSEESPTFRINRSPTYSRMKCNPRKKTAGAAGKLRRRYVPPKRQVFSEQHGVTIKKVVPFSVKTMRN
jgi:hypothetical protein